MGDLRDHPRRRVERRSDPAAGANLIIPVPGSHVWVVESLAFRLVTDANVANRTVRLNADDTGFPYLHSTTGSTQAAGQTFDYSAFRGSGGGASGASTVVLSWPTEGLVLLPGHRLQTLVDNIQVGDQISRVRLLIVEYPTGPRVSPIPGIDTAVEPMDGLEFGAPAYVTP